MFLFIILYIYSKCMFFERQVRMFCVMFAYFTLPSILKKLDAFIPALSLLGKLHFFALLCLLLRTKRAKKWSDTNPCVFLFIILYIYSEHMFFWVMYFLNFRWRQFSKSWTPSFLPYPCSETSSILFIFWRHPPSKKQRIEDVYQPLCVSFYYIIYIVSICFFE